MDAIEEALRNAGGSTMGMIDVGRMGMIDARRQLIGAAVIEAKADLPPTVTFKTRTYSRMLPAVKAARSTDVVANGAQSSRIELQTDAPFLISQARVSSFSADGWAIFSLKVGPDHIINPGDHVPAAYFSEVSLTRLFSDLSFGIEPQDRIEVVWTNTTGAAGAPPVLVFEGYKLS